MNQLRYFVEIIVYAIITFGFISLCNEIWGIKICVAVSLTIGFTWGLLNEIRNELMNLNESIKNKNNG